MLKYDLENLEWQQFELLAFQCLYEDVGRSLHFIEGGSDKGRDFVYVGKTEFMDNNINEVKFIFQAKHKSKIDSFGSLKTDLKTELKKVFVDHKLKYDFYCLVTNLTISGTQLDELNEIFRLFVSENELPFHIRFTIYSYRNIEACIDKNDYLKWNFPSVIKTADFKHILERVLSERQNTIVSGWLAVFEKNRTNFVYTNVFKKACATIAEHNIIIFSGPSKSGKTFNAEMLLLKYYGEKNFTPYKVDKLEDFENYYNKHEDQIFLFDDAFGKYNIEKEKEDLFNRKIELIYKLADNNHKCVFTSREYIYKAFEFYSDNIDKVFIAKITVDVQTLTNGEKESIFFRYYKKVNYYKQSLKKEVLTKIINHKNFSPETIRAFFASKNNVRIEDIFHHLGSPDKYLEKDFTNLNEDKQLTLLSTLLSQNGGIESITHSCEIICEDLHRPLLPSLSTILNQLDGSMLKWDSKEYDFYHPSMFEFFVRYLSRDNSTYRKLLLRNINSKLLSVISFMPNKDNESIKIDENDLSLLNNGFKRMVTNPSMSLLDLNSILIWLQDYPVLLMLKRKSQTKYNELTRNIMSLLASIDLLQFVKEDISIISSFLHHAKFCFNDFVFNATFLEKLLLERKTDIDYWLLVFRITPLLEKEYAIKTVTREWFSSFQLELKSEINSLGNELYGDAYPDFKELEEYQKLTEAKEYKKAQLLKKKNKGDFVKKTNRYWFPRYSKVKEKMKVLKNSHPLGFALYNKFIENFSKLQSMEEHESNRYYFNKEKKWW